MDQLNDAPLQVKALVIVVMAGLVFAAFHFLLLEEVRGAISTAEKQRKQAQAEIEKLKQYGDAGQLEQLKLKEKELRQRLEENRKKFPPKEKIANLFQELADRAELSLDLGRRTKLLPEYADYLKKIPIQMEVSGTFPSLLKYFNSLTQDMRLTTLSELSITRLDFDEVMPEIKKARVVRSKDGSSEDLNAARELVRRLDAYAEGRPRARVKAKFIVNAYTYTGKLAPVSKKKRKKKRRKSRRRRR